MQKYLSQELSKLVDEKLMGELAFSIDQLMELAGLSVAESIAHEFPISKVLIVCGPGNNGGDGLVAARHLYHFGYSPTVFYARATQNPLFLRLIAQCSSLGIPVINFEPTFTDFSLIIDAIFGFSFRGEIRAPYDRIIRNLNESQVPIVSVDVPSGWDVESGNVSGQGLNPKMLVSLTAPKPCAQHFKGIHYLGGRFLPPALAQELNFNVPEYKGFGQCVRLE